MTSDFKAVAFKEALKAASWCAYSVDQTLVQPAANKLAGGTSRLVTKFTPEKVKDLEVRGIIRTALLSLLGSLGAPEVSKITHAKAPSAWQKPFEFLQSSSILTARKTYDQISEKFHVEAEKDRIIKDICTLANQHCGQDENDLTNASQVLPERISETIKKKVQSEPLTVRATCSSLSKFVLPEMYQQTMRTFLATALWSYTTNSSFLSTFGTVTALNASASVFGLPNSGKAVAGYSVASIVILRSVNHLPWVSTALSLGSIALFYGLTADKKTEKLSKYTPPKATATKAINAKKVVEEITAIFPNTLSEEGKEKLSSEIKSIALPQYPFASFIKRRRTEEPPKKTSWFTSATSQSSFKEKQPQILSFSDEHSSNDFSMNPLSKKAKAAYDSRNFKSYAELVKQIERTRFKELDETASQDEFEEEKQETIEYLDTKLQDPNLKDNPVLEELLAWVSELKPGFTKVKKRKTSRNY